MSQPLTASATARLVPAAGEPIPLVPTFEEWLVVGFGPPMVLPYNSSFVVEVTGTDVFRRGPPATVLLMTEVSESPLVDGYPFMGPR